MAWLNLQVIKKQKIILMTNFVRGSISIDADLIIIQDVLVEYKYIEEWEKGFDSFKELHVSNAMKTIVHWDIEHDIGYIFSVKENKGGILLELMVGDLTTRLNEKYNLEATQHYVDTVLNRIKSISERLQVVTKQVRYTC